MILNWKKVTNNTEEAWIGTEDDGVRFSLDYRPTCHRRGMYRLLIEVIRPNHDEWGCFDDADQPMRNYHIKENALSEAEAIANVLLSDRFPNQELSIKEIDTELSINILFGEKYDVRS
jgi:hypothetical protein